VSPNLTAPLQHVFRSKRDTDPLTDGALPSTSGTGAGSSSRKRRWRIEELQHGNHWDRVDRRSFWSWEPRPGKINDGWDQIDFGTDRIARPDQDDEKDWGVLSNCKLHGIAAVSNLLQRLASLRTEHVPSMHEWLYEPGCASIPLFRADNDDEYQVFISTQEPQSKIAYTNPLPTTPVGTTFPWVTCPTSALQRDKPSDSRCQVMSGIELSAPGAETAKFPKRIVPIGLLIVRSRARFKEYMNDDPDLPDAQVGEQTDFTVVMDAESSDMPVWILAGQLALRERAMANFGAKAYAMFQGLLSDDSRYFDAACIMSSIHQLATNMQDPAAATFQDAVELVRQTRAVIDPIGAELARNRLEFQGNLPGVESLLASSKP
jgi:hypothetical protein